MERAEEGLAFLTGLAGKLRAQAEPVGQQQEHEQQEVQAPSVLPESRPSSESIQNQIDMLAESTADSRAAPARPS